MNITSRQVLIDTLWDATGAQLLGSTLTPRSLPSGGRFAWGGCDDDVMLGVRLLLVQALALLHGVVGQRLLRLTGSGWLLLLLLRVRTSDHSTGLLKVEVVAWIVSIAHASTMVASARSLLRMAILRFIITILM